MIQKFKDTAGGHRFRIRAANREILMTSEAYTRPRDRDRGIAAFFVAAAVDYRKFSGGLDLGAPPYTPNALNTADDGLNKE